MHTDPLTQNLTDLINSIDQSFTRDTSANAVIAENFFVNVFLPIFAGDENPPHAATPEMWLNVARGPFKEVSVVDSNHQLLFTVPPFASQAAIKPLDGTGKAAQLPTLSAAIESARLYAGQGPNAVHNVLTNELNRRAFLFGNQEMDADHIRRWNDIFARYNRPLLPTKDTPTATTAAHANDPARDSLEIDPV